MPFRALSFALDREEIAALRRFRDQHCPRATLRQALRLMITAEDRMQALGGGLRARLDAALAPPPRPDGITRCRSGR